MVISYRKYYVISVSMDADYFLTLKIIYTDNINIIYLIKYYFIIVKYRNN